MSALKLKARGFRWVPILVLCAYTGAYSEPITKVYGPNCSTEVTREIENGSIVKIIIKLINLPIYVSGKLGLAIKVL